MSEEGSERLAGHLVRRHEHPYGKAHFLQPVAQAVEIRGYSGGGAGRNPYVAL